MGEQVRVNSDAMLMGGLLHTKSKEEPSANPTLITLHFMLSPVWAQGFPHIADCFVWLYVHLFCYYGILSACNDSSDVIPWHICIAL